MPNENEPDEQQQGAQGAPGSGEGGQAQGANAGGNAGTGSAGTGEGQGPDTTETPEQLRARIAALSKEAGGYRTKLRDAEAKLQQGERQGMDDLERTKAELADATRELAELREQQADAAVATAVTAVARTLKFHDPADAMAHLKRSEVTDDDGKVVEAKVRERLTQLVQTKPYLAVAAPNGDGHGGREGSGRAGGSMNDLIRGKVR